MNVLIVESGAGEHHVVRMKGCRCYRIRASMLEEAGVRDNAVEESAVDIEEMNAVPLGTSAGRC